MNKFLPLLFLCFTIGSAIGANKTVPSDQFPNFGIMQYFVPAKYSAHNINKPVVYLNNQFLPGKIVTNTNETIVPNGLRYNIAEDVIECQINNQFSRISSPQKLNEVEIDGVPYVYKAYAYKGNSLKGYLQKIHSGAINLYVKHLLQAPQTGNENWTSKKIFFVEHAGGVPKKVNSLKTEINRIFKGKENFANSFMKTNNYSWNDSKALIRLVNYLDNLSIDRVASR